jgi:hypothetical protein
MTSCPLPVDWLDLLEGRSTVAEHSHLAECPSCAALVAALSGDPSLTADLLAEKVLTVGAETAAPGLPSLPAVEGPAVGQLWWTVEVPEVDARLPVLLIGIEEDRPVEWFNAVPLRPDDAVGTSGDVLFLPNDTSTRLPWRALFRYQFVLSSAQLDSAIGELTESGGRLLDDALGGHVPFARAGNLIESEDDPRLMVDDWIGVASRILASEYASRIERQGEAEAEEPIPTLLILTLSRQAAPKEEAAYQLAAATSTSGLQWVRATGADPRIGAHVDGWLRLNEREGHEELVFEVKEARGIRGRVRIAVYTRVMPEAIVTEAELGPGSEVVLAADLGVSEFDVERLEIGAG